MSAATPTAAKALLDRALEIYEVEKLVGSPEKDIVNSACATIAGAQIDSRPETLNRHLCLVAAPRAKRFALASLTLDLCLLPATSDALHACLLGSWTSVFSFWRPCFAVFSEAFGLAPSGLLDPQSPKIVKLPRRIAQEFRSFSLPLPWPRWPVPTSPLLMPTARMQLTLRSKRGQSCRLPCLSTSVHPCGTPLTERGAMRAFVPRLRPYCSVLILCGRRQFRIQSESSRSGPWLSFSTLLHSLEPLAFCCQSWPKRVGLAVRCWTLSCHLISLWRCLVSLSGFSL